MDIKDIIWKSANAVLRWFNATLVRTPLDFQMESALRRVAGHGLNINSIIDIGASDGKWSRKAMAVFPHQFFLAVEPLQERRAALESCKQQYRNFDYELCVAGEVDGAFATLNVAADLDGSTVGGTGGEVRQVPMRTLDALVAARNLPGPFLLKFDTHGYEVPILRGAGQTLAKTNVIIMEAYNFPITEQALLFHEMCAYLANLGFRCYDLADPMLRPYDKAFWQLDLFFCRQEAPIFAYSHYV